MTIDIPSARALIDAATPGPWAEKYGREIFQLTDGGQGYPLDVYVDSKEITNWDRDDPKTPSDSDLAFICAARSGWPAALDEVEQLRAELEQLRRERDEAVSEVDHARLNQRTDDERELWEAGKAERDQLRADYADLLAERDASRRRLPRRGCEVSFLDMDGAELIGHCGDDASKWAAALCEYALVVQDVKLDEGWMISWFASAIEAACNKRIGGLRAQLARLRLTDEERALLLDIRADWALNDAALALLDRLLASGEGT